MRSDKNNQNGAQHPHENSYAAASPRMQIYSRAMGACNRGMCPINKDAHLQSCAFRER
jgi:hypothetical protein